MAKTIKYFIEFENMENSMLAKMEISKKEYFRQMAFLDKRVQDTKNEEDRENEYDFVEKMEFKHEYEKTIEYVTFYTIACADTILTKLECKQGYEFRK